MTTDSITLFLAIWGAVLGTIGAVVSVILAVRQFGKDKYKIKISADFSSKNPSWLTKDKYLENYIVLNILNIGFRPVQIKSVYLTTNNSKIWLCFGKVENNTFPKTLAESEYVDVYFPVVDIREEFRSISSPKIKLIAIIKDGEGKQHKYSVPELVTGEIKRLG